MTISDSEFHRLRDAFTRYCLADTEAYIGIRVTDLWLSSVVNTVMEDMGRFYVGLVTADELERSLTTEAAKMEELHE